MTAKADADVIYLVHLLPRTDAAAVSHDLMRRLADPDQPMRVVAVWSELPREQRRVCALIRYRAVGANANDIWRRVCNVTPLVKEQVLVREVAGVNRSAEPELVAASLAMLAEVGTVA